KPLKKLRYKPHGSEVFRCGSMGIYANGVNPDPSRLIFETQVLEGCLEFLRHLEIIVFMEVDGFGHIHVPPDIGERFARSVLAAEEVTDQLPDNFAALDTR